MGKDEEFTKRLGAIFREEAAEHISSIYSALFWIEGHPGGEGRENAVENIYRTSHSLKGSSLLVSFSEMETLCQSMESLLLMIKNGSVELSSDIINLLHETNDLLNELLADYDSGSGSDRTNSVRSLMTRLDNAGAGKKYIQEASGTVDQNIREQSEKIPPGTAMENPAVYIPASEGLNMEIRQQGAAMQTVSSDFIRVSSSRVETLMMKAEELVTVKLAARHYASEIQEMRTVLSQWNREWMKFSDDLKRTGNINYPENFDEGTDPHNSVRKDLHIIARQNEGLRADLEKRFQYLKKTIYDNTRSAGGLVDDLLSDMKNILLMPLSGSLEMFRKFVRDLSREQGKLIDFIIEGGEQEVDRRVLQEMKDPFSHIIRNCIDHGIEPPDVRKKLGKPERGTIKISAAYSGGGKIVINFSDDGAGINPAEVRFAAVKMGLVSAGDAEKLNDAEILHLVFESGISTSPVVSNVSGRGLGMAIVREKAEKLGGSVSVESAQGRNTLFSIILPVNISTFRGIHIECGGREFVVPTKNVDRIIRVLHSDIITVENMETISFNGSAVSLARLHEVLEIPAQVKTGREDYLNVMIVPAGLRYMAFVIDSVLNEGEMLLKNLGPQLQRVRNVAGATVLVSGIVVPVLSVFDLVKSVQKLTALTAARGPAGQEALSGHPERKSILVAEDSITARSLYVSILETAGYSVTTAVDGIDALTKLINGGFDLVVTDVQMPKMTGFELTEKIRGDARYKDLPVILVTGLETSEDKRKGIDAGADAYIVKSSFDQNDLVNVVKRFI